MPLQLHRAPFAAGTRGIAEAVAANPLVPVAPQPPAVAPEKIEGPTNLLGELGTGKKDADAPAKPEAPKIAEKPLKY